ncbi:MAG: ferredoxin, partial [Eubacterium sp.]
MDTLSRKIVVALDFPVNGDITGDRERLIAAVSFDHHPVNLHYSVFKKYYKICRESHWHFTVTLIWTKDAWEIIRLEPGDTTDTHYGLAVDLGSTTVIMQVVDLNNGHVIDEHRTFNQQITFGD